MKVAYNLKFQKESNDTVGVMITFYEKFQAGSLGSAKSSIRIPSAMPRYPADEFFEIRNTELKLHFSPTDIVADYDLMLFLESNPTINTSATGSLFTAESSTQFSRYMRKLAHEASQDANFMAKLSALPVGYTLETKVQPADDYSIQLETMQAESEDSQLRLA